MSGGTYSVLQEQIRVIKSGTDWEKKKTLTPQSIADVRAFIESERANRSHTNYSLEGEFHEWMDLIKKYEGEKVEILNGTRGAVSDTPRSMDVTLTTEINALNSEGVQQGRIPLNTKITLSIPTVKKTITIGGGNMVITQVKIADKNVWVQEQDILRYINMPNQTQTAPTVETPVEPPKTPEQAKSEIQSALSEITDNDFNSLRLGIEKAQSLITTYEKIQPQYREGVRGAFGLLLLERLSKAGYAVTLQGNTVNVTHSKPENQSRATQIETYFRGQPNMGENLALGMIYRSSEIQNYSDVYLTEDKKSIKPETPRNYLDYLRDAQAKNGKLQAPQDQVLLQSSSTINTILSNPTKVKGIILGTPFLADALKQIQQNPALQGIASQITGTTNPSIPAVSPSTSGTQATSSGKQNLTTTNSPDLSTPEKLPDWKEKPVARIFGEIGLTASQGLSDLMSQPHILGGVLIAAIAAWIFGDWKKGLGVIAGAIGLDGIYERMKANGFDPNKAAQSAQNAANTASNAVTGAASSAAAATGLSSGPASSNNTGQSAPSPYQADLRKKVEASGISTDIDKLAGAKNSKYPGKLDDYLKFIENDLKDIPLSKLFPSDHKKSIFFDNFDTDFSVDSKLSGKMLKRVLREYLTGNQVLTGTGDKLGEAEKEAFLRQHNITSTDIQNKKLSDILESIHKVRVGAGTPAPVPASTKTQPTSVPVAQNNNLTAITTIKIGTVDKKPGDNVQTIENVIVRKDDGGYYDNPNSKLPEYTISGSSGTQKYRGIPKDGVVKIGSNMRKISNLDYIEIEYSGEKVYVAITGLKS